MANEEKNISLNNLDTYTEEMKEYIKSRGSGVTMEELTPLLDEKAPMEHTHTKFEIGLNNVENKSSETIRNEITKNNVTTALGYTPYTPSEVDTKINNIISSVATDDDIDALFT